MVAFIWENIKATKKTESGVALGLAEPGSVGHKGGYILVQLLSDLDLLSRPWGSWTRTHSYTINIIEIDGLACRMPAYPVI
jgi:hypothetical protein